MKPDGGNAFPEITSGRIEPENIVGYSRLALTRAGGMSLRDYFAAKALPVVMQTSDLQAVLSWPDWSVKVAQTAYEIADAMLAERAK